MKTIAQMFDNLEDWSDERIPAIVSIPIYFLIWSCLFPVRILACLVFPPSASYSYHPMHKYKSFWMFEEW